MEHLHLFVARLCVTSPEDEAIVRNPFVDPAPHSVSYSQQVTPLCVVCSGTHPNGIMGRLIVELVQSSERVESTSYHFGILQRYPGFGTIDYFFDCTEYCTLYSISRKRTRDLPDHLLTSDKDCLIFLCRARV